MHSTTYSTLMSTPYVFHVLLRLTLLYVYHAEPAINTISALGFLLLSTFLFRATLHAFLSLRQIFALLGDCTTQNVVAIRRLFDVDDRLRGNETLKRVLLRTLRRYDLDYRSVLL